MHILFSLFSLLSVYILLFLFLKKLIPRVVTGRGAQHVVRVPCIGATWALSYPSWHDKVIIVDCGTVHLAAS